MAVFYGSFVPFSLMRKEPKESRKSNISTHEANPRPQGFSGHRGVSWLDLKNRNINKN
jgi:hypothetical protein